MYLYRSIYIEFKRNISSLILIMVIASYIRTHALSDLYWTNDIRFIRPILSKVDRVAHLIYLYSVVHRHLPSLLTNMYWSANDGCHWLQVNTSNRLVKPLPITPNLNPNPDPDSYYHCFYDKFLK